MDPAASVPASVTDGPLPVRVVPGEHAKIAVLSDVHGNVPAFAAALTEIAEADVEGVAILGDLTWGPQPVEILAMVDSLGMPAWCNRGNAERALIDMASGDRPTERPVDQWMIDTHRPDGVAALTAFAHSTSVEVGAIGSIRFCHGSPRSDIELLTPATSAAQLAEVTKGVSERTIAHGHTHLQYQRVVGEHTVFGPGSVGIPYGTEGRPGARWALVTDAIELRVSEYDIEESIEIARSVGYPGLANYEKYLRTPLTLGDIVEEARIHPFSD
ncbi:MAG TPA: metallophosphoesterase family protein [Galbitalea sp.]|nr:metallophosphoesterase family protein [Galbitalea sp.]